MPATRPTLRDVRQTLVLAAPLVLAQLAQMSMSFVDTLMVGRLGTEQLAAIALGSNVFFLTLMFCSGVMFAVGPVVAQAVGAGAPDDAGQAVQQSFLLAALLTLLAHLLFSYAEPLLLGLGQPPAQAHLAAAYIKAIRWGFLPALCLSGLRGLYEGRARPLPIMLITFAGVGLNVLGNYLLMFGKLGLPALGLVGAGWASAITYSAMFLALAVYTHLRSPVYRIFASWQLRPRVMWRLAKIGLPIGMTVGFEVGLFSVTAVLMGTMGAVTLAAHQIALQSASFTFMVPLGIASATAALVGQAAGRRDAYGVRRAGVTGILLSAAFMACTALVFWLLPERVVALFIDTRAAENRGVVPLAVKFLAFAAAFQVFDGLQVSAAGALRGLADTRVPMLISLLSYWGIGLTTGVVAGFVLGFRGAGLWFGLVLGLVSAAILLVLRFRHASRIGTTTP